ncbi:hypothetical protein D043_1475B, partial [Vibrio parahaemolyticus EKP-021]
ANFWIFAL